MQLSLQSKLVEKKCNLLRDAWHIYRDGVKIGSILYRNGFWFCEKGDGVLFPVKGLKSRTEAKKTLDQKK